MAWVPSPLQAVSRSKVRGSTSAETISIAARSQAVPLGLSLRGSDAQLFEEVDGSTPLAALSAPGSLRAETGRGTGLAVLTSHPFLGQRHHNPWFYSGPAFSAGRRVLNSCRRTSTAVAIPSVRTTTPEMTSCSCTPPSSATGQSTDTFIFCPTSSGRSVVKLSPQLLRSMVRPEPASTSRRRPVPA